MFANEVEGKSYDEVLQWVGDILNSDALGAGAAPLKRPEAQEIGSTAVSSKVEELNAKGVPEQLKKLTVQSAKLSVASSLSAAIAVLPQCGVAIPASSTVGFLVLITALLDIVIKAKIIDLHK